VHPGLCERRRDVAGAGGEIEDGVAGARRGARDERLRNRNTEPRDGLSLRFPANRGRVPPTAQLLLRLYAATPLNWGRMSLPYASSVSSWPFVIR